jgi:hypothetical protein
MAIRRFMARVVTRLPPSRDHRHEIVLARRRGVANARDMRMTAIVGAMVASGLVGGGIASADPTARFGLTFGYDHQAPDPQLGPQVAVGERLGRFVGELEYAYLSFFSPESHIQRLGVTLRADVLRANQRCLHYACTRASSIYVEGGAAERYGQWLVDATTVTPARSPQPEMHVGVGYEIDNQIVPYRNGWQLGLRFAVAPHDPLLGPAPGTACRGTGCAMPGAGGGSSGSGGGLDRSIFIEWMFLVGG